MIGAHAALSKGSMRIARHNPKASHASQIANPAHPSFLRRVRIYRLAMKADASFISETVLTTAVVPSARLVATMRLSRIFMHLILLRSWLRVVVGS
jgi:hypothetical protein